MKLIFLSILTLFAAAYLAKLLSENPGYVILSYGGDEFELTLALFCIIMLAIFALIYALLRLIIATGLMPKRLRRSRKQRTDRQGQAALTRGLLNINEGKWGEAEKQLIKSIRSDETALLGYLSAAQAAQEQGNRERRDGYLVQAVKRQPKAKVAVTLALARLQSTHGEAEQAVKTLKQLPGSQAAHPHVLKQLGELYVDLGDWAALVALLPSLKRIKTLSPSEFQLTSHNAYVGLIKQLGENRDSEALWQTWMKLPNNQRNDRDISTHFTHALMHCGQADKAEEILYNSINREWSDDMVYLYGLLDGDAEIHYARASNWLKKQSDNPIFLLSLGRLALRSHQWVNARTHLEASLAITPHAETYQELGNLLAFLNEQSQAVECYRCGLAMSTETFVNPELKSGTVVRSSLPHSPTETAVEEIVTPQITAAVGT